MKNDMENIYLIHRTVCHIIFSSTKLYRLSMRAKENDQSSNHFLFKSSVLGLGFSHGVVPYIPQNGCTIQD